MKQDKLKKNENQTASNGPLGNKKSILFMILFIFIAVMTVWAVMSQSKEFSLANFLSFIQGASYEWLGAALFAMLGFVFFEAIALLILSNAFGNRQTLSRCYMYSASDIYFSAITPSATGGQPASAYFMIKNGMNGMMVAALLVANLMLYTLAIVVIGTVCFIMRFDYFMQFSLLSKLLIIAGFVSQIFLLIFFFLLLKRDKLLQRICNFILKFLCKIRIIKRREYYQKKLDGYMDKYRQHSKIITGHRKSLFFCFFFNLLQRISQIMVTVFVCAATTGKDFIQSMELLFWQGYATLGSNSIPIPGAMGVSDYLMIDGFTKVLDDITAVNLELLSRSFSFYSCVIICGISTLVYFLMVRRRGRAK